MQIKNHKLVDAEFVATKKMGGIMHPRILVMHYTAGYTTAGDVQTLARDPVQASAHLVLSREGKWTQIVPFNRVAWHAGPSVYGVHKNLNSNSIGIEISNAGWISKENRPGVFKDQYGNTIEIDNPDSPKKIATFQNRSQRKIDLTDWEYHPHGRLAKGTYLWENYTEEQLEALDELVKVLIKTYGIEHIVTHEEIDTRKWKTDPGPMFPMERYKNLLGNPDADLIMTTAVKRVIVNSLNVRGGPGMNFSIIGALRYGESVDITEVEGDWALVDSNGWVAHRYLT
jgi:N-acetylmuramoyl-L-alanine amidase